MTGDSCSWDDLETEIAQWRGLGRPATLWWRDDDATSVDAALQRLACLSARWQVPLGLAVIPARATATLASLTEDCARVQVLQHGYAHVDYGNGAEPAAELGEHRSSRVVLDELSRGRERLQEIFSATFLPVLVPPWNRIADRLVPQLADLGFIGLSCFSARERYDGPRGLSIANCHVDPVHWKKGGVFRGESKSLSMLVAHLRARRQGHVDADEPTGVLSHHWSHDAQTWAFLEQLFERTHGRSDVQWLHARQVFTR